MTYSIVLVRARVVLSGTHALGHTKTQKHTHSHTHAQTQVDMQEFVYVCSQDHTAAMALDTSANNFERGAKDLFKLKAPDVGDVSDGRLCVYSHHVHLCHVVAYYHSS